MVAIQYEIVESPETSSQAKQWDTLLKAENDINDAWLKEGLALKKIRDEELFVLRGYSSFADYYTLYLKYHKSTVSLRISAAETALKVRIDTEKFNPSQSVYRELSFIPEDNQQTVINRACEISLTNGG